MVSFSMRSSRIGSLRGFFIGLRSARMRRTEVRPISSLRAISVLAIPARCSLRISGMPARRDWPTRLFALQPRLSQPGARAFAQDLTFELREDCQQAGHRATGGVVRSSASVSDTNPTPQCSSSCSVASRSVTTGPAIQSPDQPHIDLTAARPFHQLLAEFPFDCTGADLADLHRDGPAAPATYSRSARICIGSVC